MTCQFELSLTAIILFDYKINRPENSERFKIEYNVPSGLDFDLVEIVT